ncbi:transmembrane protein 120 homolog [Euwallacea fornicatus]|uniref:transmembrane protein 120 homolog n=1 Tax=Euwallacea fornicatus TaxID=995702 RepID=UPI0033906081
MNAMNEDLDLQWEELGLEYKLLDEAHQNYLKSLKELIAKQKTFISQIAHQRYRLKAINDNLQKCANTEKLNEIKEECVKREAQLQIIEETLPRQGGVYLRVILGNINVGFLSEEVMFKYKDAYEKFKLICIVIATVLVLLNMSVNSRFFQKIYLFFLVWYYCTLTIRESVLRANGSKIKTWWRIHHGLSVFASIVLLVWPENSAWDDFKGPFFKYNLYNCLVQYLQFNYQSGALYRLRALGKKDNMEITVEGFQHWMWRGLAFLYPFLFGAYIFQLVNAYMLYGMYMSHPESSWHVLVTFLFMLTFFIGNSITTLLVIPNKLKNNMVMRYKVMARKLYCAVSVPKINLKKSNGEKYL